MTIRSLKTQVAFASCLAAIFLLQIVHAAPLLTSRSSSNDPLKFSGIARVKAIGGGQSLYSPTYKLSYYGGPLLNNVQVTNIYMGKNVHYRSKIDAFTKFYVTSKQMDMIIQEYSPPKKKPIGYGSFVGSYIEMNQSLSELSEWYESEIKTYFRNLTIRGSIKPNNNSYYGLYFAPNVTAIQVFQGFTLRSCQDFCGFHGAVDISDLKITNTPYLYYAVYPDQSGLCMGGCGISSDPFANTCSVTGHELAEVITDPAMTMVNSTRPQAPLAWYDDGTNAGGEIGDLCNTLESTLTDKKGVKWTVQKIWSNKYKKCLAELPAPTKPTSKPNRSSPSPSPPASKPKTKYKVIKGLSKINRKLKKRKVRKSNGNKG
ncbi:hypothetical protein BC830DRAFT_1153732 [Chytriomyces sp. MP71]|nr:hypothetical protein BC830DRAFT_1153732 [Chytriomyces sp. MP71]